MSGKRIGVLCGGLPGDAAAGPQAEAAAGPAVWQALRSLGHDAVLLNLGLDVDIALRAEGVEVAFLACRGRHGEDGSVQGLLELLGIPYTGSDVLATALALDSLRSRQMLRQLNLPTPPCYSIAKEVALEAQADLAALAQRHGGFGYPAVVRPRRDSLACLPQAVADDAALLSAVQAVRRLDDEAIVERHVGGRHVVVALLGDELLGALEHGGRADAAALGCAEAPGEGAPARLVPVGLSAERLRGVVELALRASRGLGCQGAVRVDLLASDRDNEMVLAVNPRPALAPGSVFGQVAAQVGLPFADLVERVLGTASLHGRRHRDARLCGPRLERRARAAPLMPEGGYTIP